jgi:hypothetical protein
MAAGDFSLSAEGAEATWRNNEHVDISMIFEYTTN